MTMDYVMNIGCSSLDWHAPEIDMTISAFYVNVGSHVLIMDSMKIVFLGSWVSHLTGFEYVMAH
jgi:hypothetical protein